MNPKYKTRKSNNKKKGIHLIAREALIDQSVPNSIDKKRDKPHHHKSTEHKRGKRKSRPRTDMKQYQIKIERKRRTIYRANLSEEGLVRLCWRDPAQAERRG